MITLSNGYQTEYMAASGALANDGRGWWWEQWLRLFGLFHTSWFTAVTKTLTFTETRGNYRWYKFWTCIRFIPNIIVAMGVINAVGLTNPGYEWWCRKIGPRIDRKKQPVIVSLSGTNIEQMKIMAAAVSQFDIVGIELNFSCPNVKDTDLEPDLMIDICFAVKSVTNVPVGIKLSVVHQQVEYILAEVKGIVEWVSINSVLWSYIYNDSVSPLVRLGGGGVSGAIAKKYTWAFAREIQKLTTIPVVWPSVWEFDDIENLRLQPGGVDAISFGSIFMRYPWRPTIYVRRDRKKIWQHLLPSPATIPDHL